MLSTAPVGIPALAGASRSIYPSPRHAARGASRGGSKLNVMMRARAAGVETRLCLSSADADSSWITHADTNAYRSGGRADSVARLSQYFNVPAVWSSPNINNRGISEVPNDHSGGQALHFLVPSGKDTCPMAARSPCLPRGPRAQAAHRSGPSGSGGTNKRTGATNSRRSQWDNNIRWDEQVRHTPDQFTTMRQLSARSCEVVTQDFQYSRPGLNGRSMPQNDIHAVCLGRPRRVPCRHGTERRIESETGFG